MGPKLLGPKRPRRQLSDSLRWQWRDDPDAPGDLRNHFHHSLPFAN